VALPVRYSGRHYYLSEHFNKTSEALWPTRYINAVLYESYLQSSDTASERVVCHASFLVEKLACSSVGWRIVKTVVVALHQLLYNITKYTAIINLSVDSVFWLGPISQPTQYLRISLFVCIFRTVIAQKMLG